MTSPNETGRIVHLSLKGRQGVAEVIVSGRAAPGLPVLGGVREAQVSRTPGQRERKVKRRVRRSRTAPFPLTGPGPVRAVPFTPPAAAPAAPSRRPAPRRDPG